MPTPSQQTNRLIALTQVALAGGTDQQLDELDAYLNERMDGSGQAREDFLRKAEEKGESFRRQADGLIQTVLAQFDEYEKALAEIGAYLDENRPEAAERAIERLTSCTPLLFQALERYGQAYMGTGSSRLPFVNAVKTMIAGLSKGQVKVEEAQKVLAEAGAHLQEQAKQLESSPLKEELPALENKQAALEAGAAALQNLEKAVGRGLMGAQLAALEKVESTQERLQASEEDFFEQAFMREPTPMPATNVLIHCLRGWLSQLFPSQRAQEGLRWYQAHFRKQYRSFEELTERDSDSAVVAAELPKVQDCLDLHLEQLGKLEAALEADERDAVQPILAEMETLMARLHESLKVFHEAAEREGQVICVSCGASQAPGASLCGVCGKPVGKFMDGSSQSTFTVGENASQAADPDEMVLTANLHRLFQACQDFYDKKIEAPAFRATLQWAQTLLVPAEQQLQETQRRLSAEERAQFSAEDLEIYDENFQVYEESKELFLEGIAQFREGLDKMSDFVEDGERQTLVTGIEAVWRGASKIHRCQRLAEALEAAEKQQENRERSAQND